MKSTILSAALALAFAVTCGPVKAQTANQHYENAVQAYEQGELNEAYIHLKNALQQDTRMVSARILLAQMYFGAGDIVSAQAESEKALELGADINLVLPIYGTSLVVQQKPDELLALESRVSAFSKPTTFEWLLLKAQALLLKNKVPDAQAALEEAAAMFPADVRSINSLAAVYVSSGLYADADAQIAKSLTLDPLNPKTWQLRGELAFAQENYPQAKDYFLRAHELDEEDLRVLRSLARVSLHLGDQAQMKTFLEKILQVSRNDPSATLLNAILMIGQGDAEIGETMLSNLSLKLGALEEMQLHTSDGMLFIRAASDYVRRSDRSAITLFNAYLARNKDDLAAIRMLVDLYVRNNERRLATDLLRANKEAISRDLGLSLQLLHFYIQDKNTYAAKELLQELKADSADMPYVPILEAEFLRNNGKPKEALAALEQAKLNGQDIIDYDLLRGALQLQLNDYEAAEKSARRMQRVYPESVRAYNFGGVTALRMGELDAAQTAIARALELSPDNIEANFNQAMLQKKRGDIEASSRTLQRTLVLLPSHTKSILLMARNYFLQGEVEQAIEWTRKAALYDRTSNRPAEMQLEIYASQQDWENAVKTATTLSSENPLNADYLIQLADLYVRQKQYELAQRPLNKLAALWAEEPQKLRELAGMYLRANHTENARKTLQNALEFDAQSFPVRLDLAGVYLREGELETASTIASALSKEFGERAPLYYLQGDIASERQQYQLAHENFLKAYQLDKNLTPAIFKLYELSARGVGAETFTATLESALKNGSLPPWAVRLLADSYLLQSKPEKAARYYEQLIAIEEIGSDPQILNNLANIYAENDLDKGLQAAMKAYSDSGENSSALLDTIGWIYARKGEHEKALSFLRQAFAKNSNDPQVRYHTGATLNSLGRTAEAEKELRAALVLSESFAGREEAQSLLDQLVSQRSN